MTQSPTDIELSALLASRICHDLVNPIGALAAGLEVMESEDDPEMRQEAQKLIAISTQKSIAMLSFARLAFGAGGAFGDDIDVDEAKHSAQALYEHFKPELDWQLPAGPASKSFCKILLSIVLFAADCVPRNGSRVIVSGDRQNIMVTAIGPKVKLKDTLVEALKGNGQDLEPKMTPAYIAAKLARSIGADISCDVVDEETVRFYATFATA
ncbi:MAG: histidine phosphotransferase family protein [bacterium]